jgi:hypothetical protein
VRRGLFKGHVRDSNVQLDDGIETKREFEIVSDLMGRAARFTIPASEFSGMDWPIKHMGSAAITYPNQREYAYGNSVALTGR